MAKIKITPALRENITHGSRYKHRINREYST